ncbi:MAG: hypothetical protein ACYC1M_04090 [Armatimonadota bacterium]
MASTNPYPVYCVNCRRSMQESDTYCPYCKQDQRPGAPNINDERIRQQAAAQVNIQAQQAAQQAARAQAAAQAQQSGINININQGQPASAPKKTKGTALILAVLFGPFTWAYTYKYDGWKFWLGLILSVATYGIVGLLVIYPWAIIETAIRPESLYTEYIS